MGQEKQQLPQVESLELLFLHIKIQVEVTVPTSDALTFPHYQRTRFGCKLIDEVKPGGLRSVIIYAQDCTAMEAVNEYQNIINKQRGYAVDQQEEDYGDEN
jgi:hypothetical protein